MAPDNRALLIEFDSEATLRAAISYCRQHDIRIVDAFSPYPLSGMRELLNNGDNRSDNAAVLGGLFGAVAVYWLVFWCSALQYPLNVGGRPANSLPIFAIASFEGGILFAALAVVAAFFAGTGLPRLHHPVFEAIAFGRSGCDRFFLLLDDEACGRGTVGVRFLELGALRFERVSKCG